MKNIKNQFVQFILLIILLGWLSPAVYSWENLIANPGFEDYTSENIAGWGKQLHTEKYVIEIDTTVKRTGKASIKLAKVEGKRVDKGLKEQKIEIEPNKQYRLNLWVKKDSHDQLRPRLNMYNANGEFLFYTYLTLRPCGKSAAVGQWSEVECKNMLFAENVKSVGISLAAR